MISVKNLHQGQKLDRKALFEGAVRAAVGVEVLAIDLQKVSWRKSVEQWVVHWRISEPGSSETGGVC